MKRYILALLVAGFSYFSMTSFSSGGGTNSMQGNRTGAGGTPNNCSNASGCHDASPNDISIDLYLVNSLGDTVKNGRYTPNAVYTLRLYAYTTGIYPKFGFQLAAEKYVGFAGAGNYVPTQGLQANPVGSYEIIEQLTPLPSTGNNHFLKDILWKAPATGSQDVKFYITVLAANDNGFANGDKSNNVQRTFQETILAVEDFNESTRFNIYPNPANDIIHLSVSGAETGTYRLQLYNLSGQLVQNIDHATRTTNADISFDISGLSSGTYFLRVSKEGKQKLLPVIKK